MWLMTIMTLLYIIAVFGLVMSDHIIIAIVITILWVWLVRRNVLKKHRAYQAAVEEVSKEMMPELYAVAQEKMKKHGLK